MPCAFKNLTNYLAPFDVVDSTETESAGNNFEGFFGERATKTQDSAANRAEILIALSEDPVNESDTKITLRNFLKTALVFLGMSNRLSNRPVAERLDMVITSQVKVTIDKLFPGADPVLLRTMIKVATASGFFDIIQVGTRWHSDCVIYNMCMRDELEGGPYAELFSFFMIGNLGYEFTAFTVIDSLASLFRVSPQNVLALIPIEETLMMVRQMQVRDAELKDPMSWFLLCHSLSTKYDHEFSMKAYKGISYVCIYAAAKLKDSSAVPQMNIPGLLGLTTDAKELLEEIAERLVAHGVQKQTYKQFILDDKDVNPEITKFVQDRKRGRTTDLSTVRPTLDDLSDDSDDDAAKQ